MQTSSLRPFALAALLCTGTAHADVPYVATSAFTLQGYDHYPDSVVNVLSDTGRSITLGLPTFAADISTGSADSFRGPDDSEAVVSYALALYEIRPKAGYRITGFKLSATAQGMLVAAAGDWPGFAYNYVWLDYDIYHFDGDKGSTQVSDLQGEQQVALASRPLALDTQFSVALGGYTMLGAYGGYVYDPLGGEPTRTQSLADMNLRDVTLTFTVSAVPEPQAWLSLLGGLGIVGALAMRTRRTAPIC
jgi:hypothetical protein